MEQQPKPPRYFLDTIYWRIVVCSVFISIFSAAWIYWYQARAGNTNSVNPIYNTDSTVTLWHAPDTATLPQNENGNLIRYGRQLVMHTARYIGPQGSVRAMSNGMNCQNCHLDAGTKTYGNNYGAVAPTYPRFRARSGTIESVEKRINDCLQRSLNGTPLQDNSRELRALSAYITWLGSVVPKGIAPLGSGLPQVRFMTRPASPLRGKVIYAAKCAKCHGPNGEGVRTDDRIEWLYPPLWGEHSYNTAAGLYRLSRMAGYIRANMPYGASFDAPRLTDDEAWDLAAFVNSMPRPVRSFAGDWPDVSKKPFDHPFPPFADSFSAEQHKYGPFRVIRAGSAAAK